VVDGVLVYVDGIESHFEQAEAAGAALLSGIEEGPEDDLTSACEQAGQRHRSTFNGASSSQFWRGAHWLTWAMTTERTGPICAGRPRQASTGNV
jgi:hypothetical protein